MSSTNFAQIGQVVDEAVAHELGEAPIGSLAPARYRKVAGLRVVSNAARDAQVDQEASRLLKGLKAFRNDALVLKGELAKVGITPLAVLPLTAWDRLCDRAGLYRFRPNADGAVRVSAVALKEFNKKRGPMKRIDEDGIFGWVLSTFVLSCLAMNVPRAFDMDFRPGFLAVVVSAAVAAVLSGILVKIWDDKKPARRLRAFRAEIKRAMKNGSIHSLLWPGFREPSPNESRLSVRLALPEPPAEVQEKLIAAEHCGWPLDLAVVPGAIGFRDNPADVLLERMRRDIAEEERRIAAQRDPIVYVVRGQAVAVVAQYGDFPIEQELVNEVVNSVHLA